LDLDLTGEDLDFDSDYEDLTTTLMSCVRKDQVYWTKLDTFRIRLKTDVSGELVTHQVDNGS